MNCNNNDADDSAYMSKEHFFFNFPVEMRLGWRVYEALETVQLVEAMV